MSAEPLAFVDTNILVYALDQSDPIRATIAERTLQSLLETDRLVISTQVLQELYVTVTRKIERPLTSDQAVELIDHLSAWPVILIDTRLIREAASISTEATISFWDGLIVAAARRSGAAELLTEDLNHGQEIAGVRIVNPFRGPEEQPTRVMDDRQAYGR